jgi:hypothetical protein
MEFNRFIVARCLSPKSDGTIPPEQQKVLLPIGE